MSISEHFNEFILEADFDAGQSAPQRKRKVGTGKFRKNRDKRQVELEKTMTDGSKVVNMSRRSKGSVLCAFPTFDRCDSLLFFPTSFSRCVNSADVSGMRHLFLTHTSKKCDVFFGGHNFYVPGFLRLMDLSIDLHPDTINCVRATKVVNNTVQAKFFTKFSECDAIFESVGVAKSSDPMFQMFYGHLNKHHKRSERYRPKIDPLLTKTEQEKEQLYTACDAPGDLMVYATMYLTLTFDHFTRKITQIDYEFEVTSIVGRNEEEIVRGDAAQLMG